ncbi:MAG: hypothetical protein JSR54_10325, partial [Proteobacteria bacterium]|nr:hypothetical protein [Pseudomonadota bacterium]
ARAAHLRLALGAAERGALAYGTLEPTDAWVMTEAVLKAAGLGVAAAPRVRLEAGAALLDGVRYRLERVPLEGGVVAWLASGAADVALSTVRHAAVEFAALP